MKETIKFYQDEILDPITFRGILTNQYHVDQNWCKQMKKANYNKVVALTMKINSPTHSNTSTEENIATTCKIECIEENNNTINTLENPSKKIHSC